MTEVVAIEPEPTLRALAESAAHSVPVTVLDGVAEDLPFADGEFDAAVVSLVLCSVPDQGERSRRSGGCSGRAASCASTSTWSRQRHPKRGLFRAADATGLWPKLAAGCHLARDTAGAITAAGFEIERCERIEFRSAAVEPRLSYLLGSARR